MRIRELEVPGAWEFTPRQFGDPRGVFLEWFKSDLFVESLGHPLDLRQANCSVSEAGVIRGVHFADVPPGQAKYVTCTKGAIIDIAVDLRVGSPTFGRWDAAVLDDVDRRALYLSEGLGHAFMALEDGSTVVYLCSTGYVPAHEHGIHPLDAEIGIEWPTSDRAGRPVTPKLSDKDLAAPGLSQARESGLLPTTDQVAEHIATLRA